jgi:integrase
MSGRATGQDPHDLAGAGALDGPYAADRWRAEEVGSRNLTGGRTLTFATIRQPWLRDAAKRWARHRLAVNCAFNTVMCGVGSLKRFSGFLDSCRPPVNGSWQVDRALLEHYLAWLRALPLAESTKAQSRVLLRSFLEDNRRYRWVEGIDPGAVLYHDELASRQTSLPRFLSEAVMVQLESEANLAKLSTSFRNLVVVISETGLRAGDACALGFDPIVTDSSGWPCLRFGCSKMRAEQMVPMSSRAVEAIRAQQLHVTSTRPAGSLWLFPSRRDPSRPYACAVLRWAFKDWQDRIGLHDGSGRPVRVTPHQLRHTFVISPAFRAVRDMISAA